MISRVGLPSSSRYQEPISAFASPSVAGVPSSVWDVWHVRHSNMYRSGKPLNRRVFRAERMVCAQLEQREGAGLDLLVRSLRMNRIPHWNQLGRQAHTQAPNLVA